MPIRCGQTELVPGITLSVVAQSNLSSAFFNLVHGVTVTAENASFIADTAVRKLTKLEFQIVRGIRSAGLTGGNDEATLAQTLQSATGVLRFALFMRIQRHSVTG